METSSFGCIGLRGTFFVLFFPLTDNIERQGIMFGFSIGINVTTAVFLGTPPPVGFGYSAFAVSGFYGTPIVWSFAFLCVRIVGKGALGCCFHWRINWSFH